MLETRARIGTGGRLVIPAAHRKALGLDAGDEVVVVLEKDELRLMTQQTAIRQARSSSGSMFPGAEPGGRAGPGAPRAR